MVYDKFSYDVNKTCASENVENYIPATRQNESVGTGQGGIRKASGSSVFLEEGLNHRHNHLLPGGTTDRRESVFVMKGQ